LFISIRKGASVAHDLAEISVPRGLRTSRALAAKRGVAMACLRLLGAFK
jgi:hypothetical protein